MKKQINMKKQLLTIITIAFLMFTSCTKNVTYTTISKDPVVVVGYTGGLSVNIDGLTCTANVRIISCYVPVPTDYSAYIFSRVNENGSLTVIQSYRGAISQYSSPLGVIYAIQNIPYDTVNKTAGHSKYRLSWFDGKEQDKVVLVQNFSL